MKKIITFLLLSFLVTTGMRAVTYPIDVTGMTNLQINTAISAAVSGGNTDVTLQFPRGATYNYAGVTLTIPTGVTKLSFTATGTGTMPVINLDQLNYSDGAMTGGLFFDGVKLFTTYGTSKYLFQPTTSAANIPAKLSITNCWVEGYRAIVYVTLASSISNVTLSNSTFYNIGVSGIISTSNVASVLSNISITNNTFIDCNTGSGAYFIDHRTANPESTTFNFSNNTFYLTGVQGNGAFRLTSSPTTAGHYTFNNNIFSTAYGTAAAFKFGYAAYTNMSGTGNYYIQNFNGITNANSVTFTQYNVAPTTLFTSPGTTSSASFVIKDAAFTGKITAGNSNCFFPATVNITGGTLVNFNYNLNAGPSAAQSFSFSTIVLRGAVTLTAPTHYEISSTSASTGFGSSLTLGGSGNDLTNQTIWVRLKAGLGVNTYNESITISTTGAADQYASCSGSVTNSLPVLDTPAGLSISSVTYTGFHASWSAVNNATTYTLRLLLNGSTTTSIPLISGTSYDVTGLTPGGSYSFAVTAIGDAQNYNSSNESAVSGSVSTPLIYLYTSKNIALAGTVTPSSTTYSPNASVQLTATKNFGYSFVNWVDSVSGSVLSSSNPYTVTMDGTKHIKAVFSALNTYKLTVNLIGGAKSYMVTASPAATVVNGNNMYEEGTVVTLTANSNSILNFSNWSNNSTNSSLQLTMNQDQSTTATYSPVDYVVGWDFYTSGNTGRPADFYSTSDNSTSTFVIRNAAGTTSSWLDKSILAAGGYYGRGAAVNWKSGADLYQYYYQTSFVATDFTDIKVSAALLFNYNARSIQKCEYSLDGSTFTTVDSYTLSSAQTWYDKTISLPADCNHAARVYVRWIPDNTSSVVGTTPANDGTSISTVYITGTRAAVNDGIAPALSSSVPASGGTGASATGKIVLNFSKNVQLAGGTTASLGNKTLSASVSGKTISFSYSGLSYNTSYTFTLAAGTVSDIFGNTLSSPLSFSFSTMNRPAVSKKTFDYVVGVDGNFSAALAAATAAASSGNRFRIFFPNGQYNIGAVTGNANQMTTISLPNVSLIGQSADDVILYNQNTTEGISSTATLYFNSSANNNYLQDLSLKNNDYRSGNASLGRCVALWDQGTKNIYKNVNVLSNQDTYYSGTGRTYFEGGSIHGTVDFICGGGDVFFNETLLYLENRTGNCITAPSTTTSYGYVFSGCTIDGFSNTNGNFYLGRPWQNSPKSVYINTKMNVLPTAAGWTEMAVVPALFAEYNSTNSVGAIVDLSMRKSSYTYNSVTTPVSPQVLTAEQAATYSVDNVLGGNDAWQPQQSTDQAGAPQISSLNRTLNWDNNEYVLCWAVFKNGVFVQFVTSNTYTIPNDVAAGAVYTVRAANEMGGLSAPSNSITLALTSSASDNFRSAGSGNSTSTSSWESSADNTNWISATSVPTVSAASVTIINGHTVNVDSNLSLTNLTLNAGSVLNVNAGVRLTVSGTMTNSGSLNLLSDATGTATILTPATIGGTGTSTVQQYLSAGRNWYISSPVTSATSASLDAANSTVYWYNEALASWPQISTGSVTLDVMKGYVLSPAETGAVTFSGALNTGTQSITVYRTAGQSKEGFNLIGNPYPSYLDWSQANRGNAMSTLWYRTKNAQSSYVFDTYNAQGGQATSLGVKAVSNMIPPMQAFWIRVADGQSQATVTVSNAQRGHADTGSNGFKTKSVTNNMQAVLRLEVSNGINTDQALVYTDPNAGNGFDDYDSPKMFNNSASIAEIYTLSGTQDLTINGLNSIPYDTEMTLGFSTATAGIFSLKASQFSNFAPGTQIILKDYVNQASPLSTDLSDGSTYTFSSDITSNNTGRFTLLFRAPSVATGVIPAQNTNCWISAGKNGICVNGTPARDASLEVYTAGGQKIVSRNLNTPAGLSAVSLPAGVYLVNLKQNGETTTRKVVLN